MSKQIWANCKFYAGQYDLSGDQNQYGLDLKADTPEATCMGETAKTFLPGLKDFGLALNGYFRGDDQEDILFGRIGLADLPVTLAPVAGADGETAYICVPQFGQYAPGAKVGDIYAFAAKIEGNGPLVKGTILLPKSVKTSSNTGVARNLGAVTAAQKVYGLLHVFSASAGDTLDVVIQSDALQTFLSPADVITFAQKAAAGSEWKTADGPLTDTWWRVSWTIAGVDPSFQFAVICGIL
jgi:hypothetical protein